jgi:magnesium-transporting ATPase (P-type)
MNSDTHSYREDEDINVPHEQLEEEMGDESTSFLRQEQPKPKVKKDTLWNREVYFSALGLFLIEALFAAYGIYILSTRVMRSKQSIAAICSLISAVLSCLTAVLGMASCSLSIRRPPKLVMTTVYLNLLVLLMIAQAVAISIPLFLESYNLFALLVILVVFVLFAFNITLTGLRLNEMKEPDFEDDSY